jgi:predicted dehydrogenase
MASVAPTSGRAADSPNETIVAAVLGMGRGSSLAGSFESLPNAQVKYLVDVDAGRLNGFAKAFESKFKRAATPITDFRRALDDKDVDVVMIATPDHWHAPAGILAMSAGKHAYVEKPCCHNAREGEMLIAAARKNKRVCQMGSQRRSWPKIMEAIARVRGGDIGRVYYSRAWYANSRGETGKRNPPGSAVKPPANLDWDLWQGPAPRQEYDPIYHPYKWHWFWHYGTGELGNNGIHALDLSRWGLGVDYPVQVAAGGGRYQFQDDQETPDTQVVMCDFPDRKSIMWEGKSCNRHGLDGLDFGASFHGEKGTIELDSSGYTVYAGRSRETEKVKGGGGNEEHIGNWLDAIRAGDPTKAHAEIEEGYKSTLLCHLGNIAWRVGRTLHCDPKNGHIQNDDAAAALWGRTYEPGWEPKV